MNTYDQGLKVIADVKKTVERVVELHTAGKNINEIVGALVADSMREAVAQMLAATPASDPKPQRTATPGWVLHDGSATMPVGLMPIDRVEVRCDIGSETSHVWAAKDVGWQKIAEWRMAKPIATPGWVLHARSSNWPVGLLGNDKVDVRAVIGGKHETTFARNLDWQQVAEWRLARIGGRIWLNHTDRDMIPRNINRNDRVDVKFNNGRDADNVLADNVDWFDVTSYRKAS